MVEADRRGCIRLQAQYGAFGRGAMLTLTYRLYDSRVPGEVECFALCHNFVEWERGPIPFVGGYSDLRDESSTLLRTVAYSMDPRGGGRAQNNATVSGLWRGALRGLLAQSLAPRVAWPTPVGISRPFVYNFAPGFAAQNIVFAVDPQNLGETDRFDLGAMFGKLRTDFEPLGFNLVHVSRARYAGLDPYAGVWPLTTDPHVDQSLSSVRRRGRADSVPVGGV